MSLFDKYGRVALFLFMSDIVGQMTSGGMLSLNQKVYRHDKFITKVTVACFIELCRCCTDIRGNAVVTRLG